MDKILMRTPQIMKNVAIAQLGFVNHLVVIVRLISYEKWDYWKSNHLRPIYLNEKREINFLSQYEIFEKVDENANEPLLLEIFLGVAINGVHKYL
jgi:hypothetical protein